MKKNYFTTLIFLVSTFFSLGQNLLTQGRGQFFEQGYGQDSTGFGNEDGVDLCIDTDMENPGGMVMVGWMEHEATNGKDLAIWKTSSFGKQLWFQTISDNWNEIATGVIADPTNHRYLVAVRKAYYFSFDQSENQNDSLLVYACTYGGALSVIYRQGIEEGGISPIDIMLAPSGFYVLANSKMGDEHINPVLLSIGTNDSLNWQQTFTQLENSRAHELVVHEEMVQFSANQLTGASSIPLIIGYSHTGSLQHYNAYTNLENTYVNGLAMSENGYYLAGWKENDYNTEAVVVHINLDLSYNQIYKVGTEGFAKYTDVSVHPNGFVATGLTDAEAALAKNEGALDILITHFDTDGEVLLHETVGSEMDERVGRSLLHPLQAVVIVVGHHEGYGIDESGNAYVAASYYEDISGLFGGSCEVPRLLFVNNLIPFPGRDPNTGYIVKEVLGNSTEETNLINFCVSNNINLISIYRLGYLFDDYSAATPGSHNFDQGIYNSRQTAISELDNFINSCNAAGIRVGYIADENEHALDDILLNKLGHFNYSHSGKFNYLQLEHEFWNSTLTKLRDGDDYIASGGIDPHFTALYNEHITILNDIDVQKANDGNVWQIFDYVAYFYNNVSVSTENYSIAAPRKAKTKEIADLVDAVIITYYQEYDPITYYGLDFLEPSGSTDFQLQRFRDRLSDFGDNSQHKIIPTFSAEYYDYDIESEPFCGKGKERDNLSDPWYYYDYLGKYLDGPEYNTSSYVGRDFHSTEDEYLNQHDIIYSSPPTGFDNIGNVKITAFGWYNYECVQGKTGFLTKSLHACNAFSTSFGSNFVYIPVTAPEKLDQNENEIKLFPNPVTHQLTLNFENAKDNHLIKIISITSELLEMKTIQSNIGYLDFSKFANGLYFLQVQNESGEIKTFKVIKQ